MSARSFIASKTEAQIDALDRGVAAAQIGEDLGYE
jgi:hypothetical protein